LNFCDLQKAPDEEVARDRPSKFQVGPAGIEPANPCTPNRQSIVSSSTRNRTWNFSLEARDDGRCWRPLERVGSGGSGSSVDFPSCRSS